MFRPVFQEAVEPVQHFLGRGRRSALFLRRLWGGLKDRGAQKHGAIDRKLRDDKGRGQGRPVDAQRGLLSGQPFALAVFEDKAFHMGFAEERALEGLYASAQARRKGSERRVQRAGQPAFAHVGTQKKQSAASGNGNKAQKASHAEGRPAEHPAHRAALRLFRPVVPLCRSIGLCLNGLPQGLIVLRLVHQNA